LTRSKTMAATSQHDVPLAVTLKKAGYRALGGGVAGASGALSATPARAVASVIVAPPSTERRSAPY
jgi:hypothetical protein